VRVQIRRRELDEIRIKEEERKRDEEVGGVGGGLVRWVGAAGR
jgi:hypothetical protein